MERIRECRADVGPLLAQYNLLYAVSLRSPEEMDVFSFARAAGVGLLNLTSNAQLPSISLENLTFHLAHPRLLYPTNTFTSRWNCVLDLPAYQAQALDAMDASDTAGGHPASFVNLYSLLPYSQPTLPPPLARITLALALQHTQLDQHLKPLAGGPP